MNLRLLLGGLAVMLSASAFAQDEIHKRNGDVIEGRIKDIGKKTITYKLSDDAGSPEYEMDKRDVKKVEYEDGTVEKFEKDSYKDRLKDYSSDNPTDRRRKGMKGKTNMGNNIFAIAPIQVSEKGIGVGLSYERMLDKKGVVSFYMPVAFTFAGNGRYDDDYYYSSMNEDLNNLYIMPGIKIYPTGSHGIVKYSIGPSLLFGVGEDYRDDLYPYYGGPYSSYYYPYGYKANSFTFGVMLTNTLNVNPTPHLYLGLELGLGVSYLRYVDNVRQNSEGLAQFGFRVGYRF